MNKTAGPGVRFSANADTMKKAIVRRRGMPAPLYRAGIIAGRR
jgi:hypothetical protein